MAEASQAAISRYALFGEIDASPDPEFVHIEDIQTRSRLYEWRITPHTHQRMFQMVFVLSGDATVRLDGRERPLPASCVVTVPSGVVHGFSFTPETVGYVVTASELLLIDARYRRSRKIFEPLFEAPRVVPLSETAGQTSLVATVLGQMAHEHLWPQLGRASMFEWLLRVLMMVVRRDMEAPDSTETGADKGRDAFARFRQLIEDHYRDHWPVAAYAGALAMSPDRLNRLCRAAAGKSAFDLVQDRLLLEASRDLIYTSATAAMIAYELGFQDPAYFARFFKRRAGMTPGAFRRSATAGPA